MGRVIKGGASYSSNYSEYLLMCSVVWHWNNIEVQVAVQNMFVTLDALVLPVTTATVG